ncbi:alpha-tocopherol transfer protein-like isoform X2 [Harmonia axyridis]|uniref:alpha-tocopherol transfer protein-like isoform X2 n=1 Tax=Harmonia axyridis TaxID=115357 RepID=UPI001E276880|nr:alpha-tocopherol transfer protein-like isoform X2 [Harmonia axyridis]
MELAKKLSDTRNQVLLAFELTEEDVNGYMTELKNWLKTQKHLPSDLLKDDLLERFLLKNKFSLEKTKTKIENYCTIRSKYRKFQQNYVEIIPSKEHAFPIPMFEVCNDLQRLIICRIPDEAKFDFPRSIRSVLLMLEIESRLDYSCGDKFLVDLAGSTAKLITKINFLLLKDTINLAIAYSARVKAVHFINSPKIIKVLMAILKTIVPGKIFNRIHIHQNLESLYEYVPKSNLPVEYGGDLKCLKEFLADYDRIFEECQELFEMALHTTSNEKLRTINCTPEGTFRKLQID